MTENQFKHEDYQFKEVNVRLCLKEASVYYSQVPLTNAGAAVDVMRDILKELDSEVACVVNLDSHLKPINYNIFSMGSVDISYFKLRDVFKSAILSNATNVILLHNHPSGNLTPSIADRDMTQNVVAAGRLLGIDVVDHVIVAGMTGKWFSLRESYGEIFSSDLDKNKEVLDSLYNVAENKKIYSGGSIMNVKKPIENEIKEFIYNYESAKDKLFVKIHNVNDNDFIKNCPHKNIDDEVALTFHIKTDLKDHDDTICITIDNEIMKEMEKNTGITKEQLEKDALENSAKLFPGKVSSLKEIIISLNAKDIETSNNFPEDVLVCYSHTPAGAATLFYSDTMDNIAKKIGGDFFAIPSSKYEFIIVPDSLKIPKFLAFESFISFMNFNELKPDDVLSNKLFHYDSKEKIFEKAENYENRTKDKPEGKEEVAR